MPALSLKSFCGNSDSRRVKISSFETVRDLVLKLAGSQRGSHFGIYVYGSQQLLL